VNGSSALFGQSDSNFTGNTENMQMIQNDF